MHIAAQRQPGSQRNADLSTAKGWLQAKQGTDAEFAANLCGSASPTDEET